MLPPLRFAIVSITSCVIGLIGARWISHGKPPGPAASRPTAEKLSATMQPADQSPAAIQARIDAVFALQTNGSALSRDHAICAALLKLTSEDFLAAAQDVPSLLARFQTVKLMERASFIEAWFHRWLEIDSAGALGFLAVSPLLGQIPNEGSGQLFGRFLYSSRCAALKALARQQPEWTKDYLAAHPKEAGRDAELYTLLVQVTVNDPAKAKQFLAFFPEGEDRLAALQGYIQGASIGGDRAGFEAALTEMPGALRESELASAIGLMSARGSETVRSLLDRIDDAPLRRSLALTALKELQSAAPEDLLPWIKQETAHSQNVADQADARWADAIAGAVRKSRAAARPAAEWAATLENNPSREIFGRIAKDWAGSNPAELCDWLSQNAATLDQKGVEQLSDAFKTLLKQDSAGAHAWADALPPGALREQARFQIALDAGAHGRIEQAQALYENMAGSDPSGALARQLATRIVQKDGERAAEWVMQRPEGPARTELFSLVAREWSERNPRAAAGWLEQISPGPERDAAIRQYSSMAVFSDPPTAAQWVQQISDPAIRAKAADMISWVWKEADPVAARAWLRSLPGVDEAWRNNQLKW